jgi:glutamyl-tRNA reductase
MIPGEARSRRQRRDEGHGSKQPSLFGEATNSGKNGFDVRLRADRFEDLMSVVVVGLNHRSAPLDVLERMTVAPTALQKALAHLRSGDHLAEVVVLSTCNRTEVYAVCETFHGALSEIHDFLASVSGLSRDRFGEHLFTNYDEAAVKHLFSVASGLDSAVVGETEILGQVRRAWESARLGESSGPNLGGLFRHALEVGKRARAETAIARGTASVSHAAVQLAAARLGGSLVGRSVLVLGAGEIGVSMVTALQHAGVSDVVVANRTRQRAVELASRLGAVAVPLHELPSALERVDLLLTATSSDTTVLEREDVAQVMSARKGLPLLIVDAALPRDVDPSAATIPGVTLLDLDSIRAFVEVGLDERRREIDRVREIVDDEAERYGASAAARQIAPVIRALRDHAEAIRRAEMERVGARLTEHERDLLDQTSRQMFAKLLHEPTMALRAGAGSTKGQRMVDAARSMFGLEGHDFGVDLPDPDHVENGPATGADIHNHP